MRKRKKSDSFLWALEGALDLGEFVSFNRSWGFVRDLEDVKHKIDALVKDGQAERAVSLYKLFLSGCFEEIVYRRPLKKPESFETRALKRWKKQIS